MSAEVDAMSESAADRLASFQRIWSEAVWSGGETRSGTGSTLAATAPLRASLRQFLRKSDAGRKVRTIVDAGCGEFTWQARMKMPHRIKRYIGLDVVPEIIEGCRRRVPPASDVADQAKPACAFEFRVHDLVASPCPVDADLVIVRDVLQHLYLDDALRFLRHAASRCRLLAVSHHRPEAVRWNADLPPAVAGGESTSRFVPRTMHRWPFCFPTAAPALVATLDDTGDYAGSKVLAVWDAARLRQQLLWLRDPHFDAPPLALTVLPQEQHPAVLLAILARNKAHYLPDFLHCIESQRYPKKAITLYVHTNDNSDETESILRQWLDRVGSEYGGVIVETRVPTHLDRDDNAGDASVAATDVPSVDLTVRPHAWTSERFGIIARIRNQSVRRAAQRRCQYYFTADCDCFLAPETLQDLVELQKPIAAPMLEIVPDRASIQGNFWSAVDDHGFWSGAEYDRYRSIRFHRESGLYHLPLVHVAYLIDLHRVDAVPSYADSTTNPEFIVFGRALRAAGIQQYLTSRRRYGTLCHIDGCEKLSLQEERAIFEALRRQGPPPLFRPRAPLGGSAAECVAVA